MKGNMLTKRPEIGTMVIVEGITIQVKDSGPSLPFKARVRSYHQCAADCMVVTRAHTREEWVVKWAACSIVKKNVVKHCCKFRRIRYRKDYPATDARAYTEVHAKGCITRYIPKT